MIYFHLITMEFDDVKDYLAALACGIFFLLLGSILILDEELVNPNKQDIFFFMTAILAVLLLIAGVLFIIVGIYGIQEVYRRDKK